LSIKENGVVWVVRYIGMDVHREFAQLAVLRLDWCAPWAGSASRRKHCDSGRPVFAR
jgi:hypothetical protein